MWQRDIQTEVDEHPDRETVRQAGRQTDEHPDRQKHTHDHTHIFGYKITNLGAFVNMEEDPN